MASENRDLRMSTCWETTEGRRLSKCTSQRQERTGAFAEQEGGQELGRRAGGGEERIRTVPERAELGSILSATESHWRVVGKNDLI